MSTPQTAVLGKTTTLRERGVVAPNEFSLGWPDQGSSERNWAVNQALLDGLIAGGVPLRDANVREGRLENDTGFLARERGRMRAAGLDLATNGYWSRPTERSLIPLARLLGLRARFAAAQGQSTFTIPEAASVAAWIADRAPDRAMQKEAKSWVAVGARYHDLVRLCVRAVVALDVGQAPFEAVFGPKAQGDLEPMLDLWPHVLVLPVTHQLTCRELVQLRAFPVHPLGMVSEPTWGDGRLLSPSEYFFHDLDHARFKVREDLLAFGIDVPDPYHHGSTFDSHRREHRTIVPFAAGHVGEWLWGDTRDRWKIIRAFGETITSLADDSVARAMELLLFEVLHEKSLPPRHMVLTNAFSDDGHIAKLQKKHVAGFLGAADPGLAVIAALPAAGTILREICR